MFGASRGSEKFWRKHPLLAIGLFLVWAVLWFGGAIRMLLDGQFRWGRGRAAELITRTGHPVFFWTVFAFDILAGAMVFVAVGREANQRFRVR